MIFLFVVVFLLQKKKTECKKKTKTAARNDQICHFSIIEFLQRRETKAKDKNVRCVSSPLSLSKKEEKKRILEKIKEAKN